MIFMDESGHTGTQRFNDGKWNDNRQPYFVLAALKIDQSMIEILNSEIEKLMKKYKIQRELKSTNRAVKNNLWNIADDMNEILEKVKGKIHIEVVNKKYCISMQIVNYCVCPYYSIPKNQKLESYTVKQCFANYLYTYLDDEIFGKFVEFFDSNRKNVRELSTMCGLLFGMVQHKHIKQSISDTMDIIKKYKKAGLQLSNLFPLEDYYTGGISTVAVCPHVDSFNHIVTCYPSESIYIHDEIKELENALKSNLENICKLYGRKIRLDFHKSVNDICVQVADFFAGNIRICIEKEFTHEDSNDTPELFKKIIECNTNFVAPYHEQCAVLSQNDDLKVLMDMYNDWAKI